MHIAASQLLPHTHTHTHTLSLSLSLSRSLARSHTHTHTHTPHRAGTLALYYYAGDSDCELTFQDVHVEATVHDEAMQQMLACAEPSQLRRRR